MEGPSAAPSGCQLAAALRRRGSVDQSGLIRRDREISIFGYFSFFMHARIISERDFQTIHLKIITHKKGLFMSNDLICL